MFKILYIEYSCFFTNIVRLKTKLIYLKPKTMKKNVGKIDMIIRIALGLIIGGLGIYFKCWLGLIGIILIATAFIGFCPAYTLFNCNTCKKEESKE